MKKIIAIILFTASFLSFQPLIAQQVDLQGVSIDPSPISIRVGDTGSILVVMKNNGPAAIPTGEATFTVTIGSNITYATPLAVTGLGGIYTVTSQNGNTLQFANTGGPVPGNPANGLEIAISVVGASVGTSALNLASSLSLTANSSDRDGNNQSASGSIIVESPLPVTLTSFTATKEGQTAQLKWTTTAETNSDRFEIERSQNGKSWDLIGTQKSNGESTTLKNYTFSDAKPLNGENLYRLKMIDRDATYAYSRIQSLTFASDLVTSFYPNPVAEKLIIQTTDFSLVKNVKIFDTNGRTVYQSSATPSSEINVQNLSSGLYVVQMVSKSGAVISHKVIKQ